MNRSFPFPATRSGLAGVAMIFLAACSAPAGPFPDVQLRTEVTPGSLASGDTAIIRAVLHNPTASTIEVGVHCGPPVLWEIRGPASDAPIYPIPLGAAFLCPGLDHHVLTPGETDTVSTQWQAAEPGTFTIRSGFRTATGLQRLTSPVTLTVK